MALYFGISCYVQLLAMHEPEKWFPPAAWLPRATAGLINVTLSFTVPIQLVLIGGFLMGFCHFRPREIGLDFAKLPAAVILTALLWAASQVVLVIAFALLSHEIALNPQWTGPGWPRAVGMWLGQLFGNTLLEEVVFRGFLLPQCLLLTSSWMPTARAGIPLLIALVLSQTLFALTHMFFNAHQPEGQWLLLAQFVMGLVFAGVYLRTGNLFLAMGVHTLVNNVSPLLKDTMVSGTGLGGGIVGVGTLVAVVFGPRIVLLVRRCVNRPSGFSEPKGSEAGGRNPA